MGRFLLDIVFSYINMFPLFCLRLMIIFLSTSFPCNYSSIRRRALDLLYGMCDVTNAKDIVEELLQVQVNIVI